MIPILFDKDEKQFRTYGLGEITDIINPKITRQRNGQYLMYFQYPEDAELSDVFEEDMRIKSDAGVRTKWQTFEISRIVREEGELIEVFAKHISQILTKDALKPRVGIEDSTAEQALRIWNANRIGGESFDVWSDITTKNSTTWEIREISSAFEALAGVRGSILDVWGGEYEFDNQMIRLHKEMGRKAPVFLEYGRNILSLKQDIQDDNVYTSIYPYAVYADEKTSEPLTKTLPELIIDGKYLEMHNKRKIQPVDFSGEFSAEAPPSTERLRSLANQYVESNEIGAPHENITVEYIDLSKTLDYKKFKVMEEVELNDRLPIFYPKFKVTNQNAKVVAIEYNPVKEENISIELGVIGQSFRVITTGGVGGRLDRVEQQQTQTQRYIINNKGNRIWYEIPDETMEHKIGDTWFEKNGQYDRIHIWNGNQWELIIDTENIDKIRKELEKAEENIKKARDNISEISTDLEVGTSFYKHSSNIGLASKNEDGTVNSIINLGDNGIAYIGGENVLIDADTTVAGDFKVTGSMLAPDATIENLIGQTMNFAEINAINFNASSIVGENAEFVRASFNAGVDGVEIDSTGMYTTGSGAWRRTYLSATGFDLYNGQGASDKAGAIGYFKPHSDNATSGENYMRGVYNGRPYIGIGVSASHSFALGYQEYTSVSDGFTRAIEMNGATGTTTFLRTLSMASGQRIYFNGGGSYIGEPTNSQNFDINAKGQIRFYNSIDSYKARFGANFDLYTDLNMNSNNIYNNSDVRLKKNITPTGLKSLDAIKQWNFVDYEWRGEGTKGTFMGVIAQDTPEIASYNEETGFYAINSSKQLMMTTHALRELALNHDVVAQLAKTNESKIHKLQQELSKANRRIEELEGAI